MKSLVVLVASVVLSSPVFAALTSALTAQLDLFTDAITLAGLLVAAWFILKAYKLLRRAVSDYAVR